MAANNEYKIKVLPLLDQMTVRMLSNCQKNAPFYGLSYNTAMSMEHSDGGEHNPEFQCVFEKFAPLRENETAMADKSHSTPSTGRSEPDSQNTNLDQLCNGDLRTRPRFKDSCVMYCNQGPYQ